MPIKLAAVLSLLLLAFGCCRDNEVHVVLNRSVASPDGKWIADWYDVNGGGAAGWEEERVRLHDSTKLFATGNDYVFAVSTFSPLEISWTKSDELRIGGFYQDDIKSRALETWNEVSIVYAPHPPQK